MKWKLLKMRGKTGEKYDRIKNMGGVKEPRQIMISVGLQQAFFCLLFCSGHGIQMMGILDL